MKTQTHWEDSHMKMEAETRVMPLPAKKQRRLLEAGRGKEGMFVGGFRRSMALPSLDFRLLVSRTMTDIFAVLRHQIVLLCMKTFGNKCTVTT